LNNKSTNPTPTIFVTLSIISLITLLLIAVLYWNYSLSPRLHNINSTLATTLMVLLRTTYFYILFSIIVLFLECYTKISFKLLRRITRFSIVFLFHVNIIIGRIIGIKKDLIRASFVAVNNSFVKSFKNEISPDKLLLLLPHCLQNYDCNYRINNDKDNCIICGNCVIGSIKKLVATYNIKVAVATGGTLARKIIIQTCCCFFGYFRIVIPNSVSTTF